MRTTKTSQKGRGNLEPGEQHERALVVEGVIGEMVSKQSFFDPELWKTRHGKKTKSHDSYISLWQLIHNRFTVEWRKY